MRPASGQEGGDRDCEGQAVLPAEDYHQDYLQKNPGGYTCHYLRD